MQEDGRSRDFSRGCPGTLPAGLREVEARRFEGGIRLAPHVDRSIELFRVRTFGSGGCPGDQKYELLVLA